MRNGLLIFKELDIVSEVNVPPVISRLVTWREQALDYKLDSVVLVSCVNNRPREYNGPTCGSFPAKGDAYWACLKRIQTQFLTLPMRLSPLMV